MIPSVRQQAIYDEWQNTDNNILIGAVAGSGKTSVLMELLRLSEYRTLFVAFNTSIKDEIQEKIEERGYRHGKAMTMHSLGFTAIRQMYRKVTVNSNKNWALLKKFEQGIHKNTLRKIRWEERLKMFYSLLDVLDASRMFVTDDLKVLEENLNTMDKVFYNHPKFAVFAKEMFKLRDQSYEGMTIEVDFADMLYLPVIKDFEIPVKPYYLFVDECQDLNLCQHKLLSKLFSQGDIHKWVAVGDPYQSIYLFAGAHSSSFDLFKERENVVEMPLDICYRCDTSIVAKANEVYPIMEAFKSERGTVARVTDPIDIKQGSMVVCRNYKPLIELYFQLLFLEKNCYIKGEDIMNNILKFLKPYKSMSFGEAEREMSYAYSDLEEDDSEKGKFKFALFKENYDVYLMLRKNLMTDENTIDSLIGKIKALFMKKTNAIVLCTIHKSKGLESDVVYILNEYLIPSKFAKSSEQLKQEKNLKYVARTRAKKELYFINID